MTSRKKKYKIVKVNGTKVAIRIRKDHERPAYPRPVVTHRSESDYDRKSFRRETRNLSEEI